MWAHSHLIQSMVRLKQSQLFLRKNTPIIDEFFPPQAFSYNTHAPHHQTNKPTRFCLYLNKNYHQ